MLALQPDGPAIEHEDRWWQWGQLAEFADRIEQLVAPGTQVGVLLRNRPPYVATLLGLVQAGATLVVINPSRGDDRTRADISCARPADGHRIPR